MNLSLIKDQNELLDLKTYEMCSAYSVLWSDSAHDSSSDDQNNIKMAITNGGHVNGLFENVK